MKRTVLIPKRSGYKKASQILSSGNFIPRLQGTIYGKRFSPRHIRHRGGEYRKPGIMWFRNPAGNTVWSYTPKSDTWKQIGPAPDGTHAWYSAIWTGSSMITHIQHAVGVNEFWEFNGQTWRKIVTLPFSGADIDIKDIRKLLWTRSEIWFRVQKPYGGADLYDLMGYNPSTDIYRTVIPFSSCGMCGHESEAGAAIGIYTGMAWTGSVLWTRGQYRHRDEAEEDYYRSYWVTYGEGEGVGCGCGTPIPPSPTVWNSTDLDLEYSNFIWNGQNVWIAGNYRWPYADFSHYPVLENIGINEYQIIHNGPGFQWHPLFWTGKEMWACNDEDQSLWKFTQKLEWTRISDGPGFSWAHPYRGGCAVYTGKLKPDGTPV